MKPLEIWELVGMEEAKEIVMRDLEIRARGLTSEPRGVLLEGPSGTGKTTLVEAILRHFSLAYQERFAIIKITTGDVSGHVTTTSQKIHELFGRIRIISKQKVVVLFMDEMEEMCMSRASKKSGHIKNEQTTNFLRELAPDLQNFYLLGTTNRPKEIDTAMFNPTRIADRIRIPVASKEERKQLIDFYLPYLPDRTKHLLVEHSKGDEGKPHDENYRYWLTWSGADFYNLSSNLETVRLFKTSDDPTYVLSDTDVFSEFARINNKKVHSMMKDDYILNPN